MIDHSRCAHEQIKSARARCRRLSKSTEHAPERAESVSDSPLALDRPLTRESVRPALWIALRRAEHVDTGYVIACEPVLMLRLSGGVLVSLTWGDEWLLYDETP